MMAKHPLPLAQRIRTYAAIYPVVEIRLLREEALDVASLLETRAAIQDAFKDIRALREQVRFLEEIREGLDRTHRDECQRIEGRFRRFLRAVCAMSTLLIITAFILGASL